MSEEDYILTCANHDPKMVEKMRYLEASSSSVKERKLKCLERRAEMGWRPPPGGPMAQMKLMSTSLRN